MVSAQAKLEWKAKLCEQCLEQPGGQVAEADARQVVPKKPLNSFQLFYKSLECQNQLEDKEGKEKLKAAGALWKDLPADRKKVFSDQARSDREDVSGVVEELQKKDSLKKSVEYVWNDTSLSTVRFQATPGGERPSDQTVTIHEQKGADVVVPRLAFTWRKT